MPKMGFSLSNIDKTQDPFDNFYLYAAGNLIKKIKIPKDHDSYSSPDWLNDRNKILLRKILESCEKSSTGVEKKLGDLYYSFMDQKTINSLRFRPIKGLMDEVDIITRFEDLPPLIAKLGRMGVDVLLSFDVLNDMKHSSIYAFYFGQGGLSLPDRDFYVLEQHKRIVEGLRKLIEDSLVLYGKNQEEATGYADSVLRVETYLAKNSRTAAELRDLVKQYNPFEMSELERRFNRINLALIFRALKARPAPYAILMEPEFFDAINRIEEVASMQDLKRYIQWHILMDFSSLLHKRIESRMEKFFLGALLGVKKSPVRWKKGVGFVGSMMGDALGRIYADEHFSREDKRRATEMIKRVKVAFRRRLEHSTWMTDATRKEALRKLDNMMLEVGYPRRVKNYSNVTIRKDDLVGNFIRCTEFEADRKLKRVGKKVDRHEWVMESFTVNAYYDPTYNKFVVPAGILQPPIFDEKVDDAVNYGAIGGIVGHEMTHGFDDEGRVFDHEGNLNDWWSKEDEARFKQAVDRVSDFYGKFEVLSGVHLNGKLTAGENIADLGGINIAFDALMGLPKDRLKTIGGFTAAQRFFISWSQFWGEKITDKSLRTRAVVDPHSPGKIRGLVPPMSHPKFVETFKNLSKLPKPTKEYPNLNIW